MKTTTVYEDGKPVDLCYINKADEILVTEFAKQLEIKIINGNISTVDEIVLEIDKLLNSTTTDTVITPQIAPVQLSKIDKRKLSANKVNSRNAKNNKFF